MQHSDGEAVGIEINPMPGVFQEDAKYDDVVLEVFPGGHRAFVDVLVETTIARYRVEEEKNVGNTLDPVITMHKSRKGK